MIYKRVIFACPLVLSFTFSITSSGVTKFNTLYAENSAPIFLLYEPKYLTSAMSMQALPLHSVFVFYKVRSKVIHGIIYKKEPIVNHPHGLEF